MLFQICHYQWLYQIKLTCTWMFSTGYELIHSHLPLFCMSRLGTQPTNLHHSHHLHTWNSVLYELRNYTCLSPISSNWVSVFILLPPPSKNLRWQSQQVLSWSLGDYSQSSLATLILMLLEPYLPRLLPHLLLCYCIMANTPTVQLMKQHGLLSQHFHSIWPMSISFILNRMHPFSSTYYDGTSFQLLFSSLKAFSMYSKTGTAIVFSSI